MTSVARTRKVTITEIQEDVLPDKGDLDLLFDDEEVFEKEEKSTEEVFEVLDEIIQDWKVKLEYIVASGLKRIRKSCKEKKVMMKYLPGDAAKARCDLLREAKVDILQLWEAEVTDAMASTHKSLEKLGGGTVREARATARGMFFPSGVSFPSEAGKAPVSRVAGIKGTAWMGHVKETPQPAGVKKSDESFQNFHQAIDELYHYLKNTTANQTKNMYMPVVSAARKNMASMAPGAKLNSWTRWHSLFYERMNLSGLAGLGGAGGVEEPKTEEDVLAVLKDFTVDQTSFRKTLEQWNRVNEGGQVKTTAVSKLKMEVKQPRRGSNSVYRMKERQRQRKNYYLREFKKEGKQRYLVVRKKEDNNSNHEVEDIFEDWRKTGLGGDSGPAVVERKRRVRKISHRAERKEMIKEAEAITKTQVRYGPLTYSEALKKNLGLKDQGPEMEEILEGWSHYMAEITKLMEGPAAAKKVDNQAEDIFKAWRHNLKEKRARCHDDEHENPEDILESWLTNLKEPSPIRVCRKPEPQKNRWVESECDSFQNWTSKFLSIRDESGRGEGGHGGHRVRSPEEYFASWKHNLKGEQLSKKKPKPDVEAIFQDWSHNLQEPLLQRLGSKKEKGPKIEKQTPTMKRKLSEKQKRRKEYSEDAAILENSKEDRREDFLNERKIENKKRSQANRRSGKRTN